MTIKSNQQRTIMLFGRFHDVNGKKKHRSNYPVLASESRYTTTSERRRYDIVSTFDVVTTFKCVVLTQWAKSLKKQSVGVYFTRNVVCRLDLPLFVDSFGRGEAKGNSTGTPLGL